MYRQVSLDDSDPEENFKKWRISGSSGVIRIIVVWFISGFMDIYTWYISYKYITQWNVNYVEFNDV